MREFLQLMTVAGVFYLSGLILISNHIIRNKLSNKYSKEKIIARFESEKLKQMFVDSGMNWSAKIYNIVRFGGASGYIIIDLIFRYITQASFSPIPLLIVLILLFLTAPLPLTPVSFLLQKLSQRHFIARESELIGFLKFYENNRSRSNPIQLHTFCKRVSGNFIHIRGELLQLSERLIDRDLEESLDWWVNQYPKDHEFLGEIRTIILTTESSNAIDAKKYLETQNQYLIKLSSDHYKKKGMFAGDIAKILNGIPSLLSFVMIITFVFMYLMIIRQQTYLIN